MAGAGTATQLAAKNPALVHHGERLAFIGLLLGGVFALVSRKGLR